MQMRVGTALAQSGLAASTRAHLLALRALSHCRNVDMDTAVTDAQNALRAGQDSGNVAAQATALQALGEIARNDGRNEAALDFFRRTRPLAGRRFLHDEVVSCNYWTGSTTAPPCWPRPNTNPTTRATRPTSPRPPSA